MPTVLALELVQLATESSLQMTDLGGYLVIRGWNELRKEQGLPPIPIPEYLKDRCGSTSVEAQEPLIRPEESRLAG